MPASEKRRELRRKAREGLVEPGKTKLATVDDVAEEEYQKKGTKKGLTQAKKKQSVQSPEAGDAPKISRFWRSFRTPADHLDEIGAAPLFDLVNNEGQSNYAVLRESLQKWNSSGRFDTPLQIIDGMRPDEAQTFCDAVAGELKEAVNKCKTEPTGVQSSPPTGTPNPNDESGATTAHEPPNVKFNLSPSCSRSSELAEGTGRKPSLQFRTRHKSSHGMVSFKASTSKISALSAIEQKHRRRISLNLPINVSTSPRPTTPPPSTPDASSPVPTRKPDEQAAIYKAEKELEYKHRHTFIGTASLNDFLDILEVSPSHMTTKAHIAQAFILLASSEQLHARQTSTSPEGWEFVTRTTHDLVCGPHEDYLNQARIMLGSISLGEFLRMMPFDEEGNVGALSMVEAFCAASHLDAKATAGVGSKAKAFRSWMVRGRDE